MANRNFPQSRIFSMHLKPVQLDLLVSIGASGAPTIVPPGTLAKQPGIASITRLSTGTYQIQLQDNYSQLLDFGVTAISPVTGSAVSGGAFVSSTIYQIVTVGTTTQAQWVAAGVPNGITAAPGVIFKAAGAGAGSGTVKALGVSGANNAFEVLGSPNAMLTMRPYTGPGNAGTSGGGFINFQCLGPTATANTAPIPTDPANGSELMIYILLSDSSVQ